MVRAIASRMLLAIIGVFLAFALAEGVLRIADIAPRRELRRFPFWWVEPHELFGWFNIPNTEFLYRTPFVDFRNPVKINSKGLREREYAYQKGEGIHRLLIIGDSFTASLEVPFKQTWHEILEDRLIANDVSRRGPEGKSWPPGCRAGEPTSSYFTTDTKAIDMNPM